MPESLVEIFGRRVRELRKERNLSQVALATRAGIEQSRISEIERGVMKEPTLEHLARLAGALGVAASSLISDQTAPPQSLTDSEEALVLAWRMNRATGVLQLIAPHLRNK